MKSRARAWLGYFGLWTLLGLVFATQLFLAEQRSSAHPATWWQALRSELPDWYLWGLLALIVGALARRFRIDRSNWERAVPIHFGASLTLGFLHLVLATALQVVLRGGESYPFLPAAARSLVSRPFPPAALACLAREPTGGLHL